ncbi:MAG: hypothetical protein RJB27_906 [Actinomycetota bacterium]|jgi:hypothetical protein
MRKRLALVSWVLAFALLAPMSADGVEFGQDATGDPNAVWMMGSSGFLYSDRIVFTAAHSVDFLGDDFANTAWLLAPGVKNGFDQKKYRIQKILKAPTYRARIGKDNTRVDDFAIVILREGMPVRNIVQVASPADIESFIREKTPVEMVGYGFQNESSRTDLQWRNSQSPHKMTSVLVSGEDLRKYYSTSQGWVELNQTILDLGVPNTEKNGSVCDGDSGAGFFAQKGDIRYYIGAVGGSQAGITNCRSFLKFPPAGGMSGVNPTYKFLRLIKEAEDFVANEKKLEAAKLEEERVAAELKAKQEAEEKARVEAELKAKLETEAKIAAEAAAKVAADAALLAKKKSQDLAKKRYLGKTCTKLKSAKTVSGVKFVCVKKGTKLVWALR